MRSCQRAIFRIGTEQRPMLRWLRERRCGHRPLHMELFGREWRHRIILFVASDRQRQVRPIEQCADRIGTRLGSMFGGNRERRGRQRPLDMELQRKRRRLPIALHRADTATTAILRWRLSRSLIACRAMPVAHKWRSP